MTNQTTELRECPQLCPFCATEPFKDEDFWRLKHKQECPFYWTGGYNLLQGEEQITHWNTRATDARISELEACRMAYASEFPRTQDGELDVGNIHHNIRALKAELTTLRAECEGLRKAMAKVDDLLRRIEETRWGHDGCCGVTFLANEARETIDDCAAIAKGKESGE